MKYTFHHTHKMKDYHRLYIWITILVIFCNLGSLSATELSNCTPGIDCWLKNLIIDVAPTSFPPIDGATLNLDQIRCQDLSSPSLSSSTPAPLTINITTTGLSVNCSAAWSLSGSDSGSGTLNALINQAEITALVTLITNSSYYGMVDNVEATCAMQINSISFTFNNGSSDTLNKFAHNIQDYLGSGICSPITNYFEINLTNIYADMNSAVVLVIENPPAGPPDPVPTEGLVDLVGNPIIELIDTVVDDTIGPTGLGEIIEYLTDGTGTFSINYTNLSFVQTHPPLQEMNFSLGEYGSLAIGPLHVNISGLNKWTLINFLEPVSSQTLDTRTILSDLQLNIEFFVNVATTGGGLEGGHLSEIGVFQADLQDCEMFLELYFAVISERFKLLAPSQLADPACLANTLYLVNINNLNFSFLMDHITIQNKPGLNPTQVGELLYNSLNVFSQSYAEAFPDVITGFLWSFPLYAANGLLSNANNSFGNCSAPVAPAQTFNSTTTIYAVVCAFGTFLLLVLIATIIVQISDARGENAPLLTSPKQKGGPLLLNSNIPIIIRYGVLFVILLNIAMFISSNSSLGASVYVVARSPSGNTQFPSLFDFSLVNSVRDMWNAKVYALSILIALFSGVWPYTKLALLVMCWCFPASILNVQRRSRILIMLDAMGKWSLIDSFVLILMMVAFHFTLIPPMSSSGVLSFEAFVEPQPGFYSFLIATMLSLVVTHLAIKVHQFAVDDTDQSLYTDGSKEALWAHATNGGPRKKAAWLTIVTLLLITSSILLGFGITTKSFEFSFKGAFGLLMKFLDMQNPLPFSVISLGLAFPDSSIDPDGLGTRFIQVSFFIFAVAMPIAYLVCLFVLWMVPLTYKFQSRLLTLTATIHAWSALEVFVISIIAALLELQQFAQFIVGDRCDAINKILEQYGDELLDHDAKCFDVVATLKSGCWILFASCAIYVAVGSLVVKGCHDALKGRLERPYQSIN